MPVDNEWLGHQMVRNTKKALTSRICAAVAVAGIASALAACSSNSSADGPTNSPSSASTAGTSTSGNASAGLQEAQANVAAAMKEDQKISVEPLQAKPPTGKTIDYMACGVPACVDIQHSMEAAAKLLGWTVKTIPIGQTPATFTSAWNGVAANPDDAVIGVGLYPNSTISSQLATLKSKGVPYVGITVPSPVNDQMFANIDADLKPVGKLMADWIVADSNASDAKVAYFEDPSIAIQVPVVDAFKSELTSLCPTCSVDVQHVSVVDSGTKLPGEVVSYLQRNTDVKYIAFPLGNMTIGLPQALQAAGLGGKIKIVTAGPTASNNAAIAAGTEAAAVTEPGSENGVAALDAVIRALTGQKMANPNVGLPIHLITKESLPSDLGTTWTIPNYMSYFQKAWQLN